MALNLKNFYKDKKVLVTGAFGFKGSWLILFLKELGADVVGVGLTAKDGLFTKMLDTDRLGIKMVSMDVRDKAFTDLVVTENPDVIFHMAAQPIVSVGYSDPVYTYTTNMLGVINLLEGVRQIEKKVSVVNITTDKVYKNIEKDAPYVETDELMGIDPYSSSKSCSEIITFSYRESFFKNSNKAISTCRAGNVIGGGDFSLNRIVPDLARAWRDKTPVTIRNFESTRPYEHVLDALNAYIILAAHQYEDSSFVGAYNVGPNTESIMRTKEIINFFKVRTDIEIIDGSNGEVFHEANLLALDSSKFRNTFDWSPIWATKEQMLQETFEWYKAWVEESEDITDFTRKQIRRFMNYD